ncbi:MAG TPA: hypothetical protein VMI31_03540 [Fimbriimonadaceae bacterium]|nr:hypothetical protein [Fimbriimonadaceae bacterium]
MRSALAAFLVFASSLALGQTFTRVQFVFLCGDDGKKPYNPPKQLVLTKQSDIEKLLKFLPGLGLNRGGLKPGGWTAWGTIRFIRPKGPGIALFFSPDGARYSMVARPGDFPAAKGFKEYLLGIEKQATP